MFLRRAPQVWYDTRRRKKKSRKTRIKYCSHVYFIITYMCLYTYITVYNIQWWFFLNVFLSFYRFYLCIIYPFGLRPCFAAAHQGRTSDTVVPVHVYNNEKKEIHFAAAFRRRGGGRPRAHSLSQRSHGRPAGTVIIRSRFSISFRDRHR